MYERKNLKRIEIGFGSTAVKWFFNIAIAVIIWFAFFSRFSSYLYQVNIAFSDLFDRTDSSTYFYGFPFVYAYESFWYEPITGSNEISYVWIIVDIVFWVLVVSAITHIVNKKRNGEQKG